MKVNIELQILLIDTILDVLHESCTSGGVCEIPEPTLWNGVIVQALDDLVAFGERDPASGGDLLLIAKTYTAYTAVLHYRLASWVYRNVRLFGDMGELVCALISKRGKLLSGAEINFKCTIGNRFVLDHGVGTVIGETAIIGDDCYFLGGVILGARGIAHNRPGQRHPHVGNGVQIGSFTSVLGPVRIGDNVFIGPTCVISDDLPQGARVLAKRQKIR